MAENVLTKIKLFKVTPSAVFKEFFRVHSSCGQRDRQVILDIVYNILRNWESFHWITRQEDSLLTINRQLVLLGCLITQSEFSQEEIFWRTIHSCNFSLMEVEKKIFDLVFFLMQHVLAPNEGKWLFESVRVFLFSRKKNLLSREGFLNLPSWIIDELEGYLDESYMAKLALSLNFTASIDLRINLIKTTKKKVLEQLKIKGIISVPCKYVHNAIRLESTKVLASVLSDLQGCFEVQNEGSQLISQLVAPARGEVIMDFCAGSGGKTLALAAIMKNTGTIFAIDNSPKRLAKLKPRVERSGVKNVHSIFISNENDQKLKRFIGKIDRVLVDVPCSGVGTLRRNPYLKNWYNFSSLKTLQKNQLALVNSASHFVKLGGKLIYATCSFLPTENEKVIDFFLRENKNFILDDAIDILYKQGIVIPVLPYFDGFKQGVIARKCLRLFPSLHGTDGFFSASMTRVY